MRKQFSWIFAFLLIAFVGDRAIGYFLKKTTEKSQFRYSRLYNSKEDADVLFVGNSRGLTFYQPEVEKLTSLNTINLSYNGMPADLAKCLVMDYLDSHKAPKVMVVDVTLCDRANDILKSGFNLYTPFSHRLDTLIKGIKSPDAWAGRKVVYGGNLSWLYRHNSEIFQRALYYRNKSDEDWLIDRVIGEAATKDSSFKSYQVRMLPEMVTHLKEMVQYAQGKGVDVKLVINPYYPAFAETIRDSFLSPLKTAVETQTGLMVMDYSTVLSEREDVGDYQHANKKGSMKYMQILAQNGYFNAFTAPNEHFTTTTTQPAQSQEFSQPHSDSFPNFATPSVSEEKTVTFEHKNENVAPPVPVKYNTSDKTVQKPIKKFKRKTPEAWYSVDTLF